jgi:hypothetical protein
MITSFSNTHKLLAVLSCTILLNLFLLPPRLKVELYEEDLLKEMDWNTTPESLDRHVTAWNGVVVHSETHSHLPPQQQACRYLNRSIAQLTATLRLDPLTMAVRPWSSSDNDNTDDSASFSFSGLDEELLRKVFRGRRIAFVGDSTLFYMTKWLKRILDTEEDLTSLSSLNLTEANDLVNPISVNPTRDKNLGFGDGNPPPIRDSNGTSIIWTGHAGRSAACSFKKSWNEVKRLRPEVLVVNFGLHWLHQYGGAPPRNVGWCKFENWLNYEAWLDEVVQIAQVVDARVLLFKTTNLMCTAKFTGVYATANNLYEAKDPAILQTCREKAGQRVSDGGAQSRVGEEDIENYCFNGTFNEAGVSYLNERVRKFVEKNQNISSKLFMGIYNDHDVETCPFTGDGDGHHYHPLNMLRIRLLANHLQCLL